MNFELLKNTQNYTLKSVVLILISLVVLVTFIASPSTLLFILAMTIVGMAGRIIYKDFGGKRCIYCNSRFVSTFRPYDNSRTDICDTCQAWRSCIAATEQERAEQEAIARAEEAFDPYEVLGVIRGASKEEIKARYHKLMKVYHPDTVVRLGVETQKIAAEKAQAIIRAYEMIGN